MKVLIVSTSERTGGAAVAAGRLVEALKRHGVKVKMLVRDKLSDRITTVSLPRQGWRQMFDFVWERLVIWRHSHYDRRHLFSVDIANTGTDITRLPEFQEADLIHLHWINQGMLSLKTLQKIVDSGKPVVWTMHDMWPCTGICHHARDCKGFLSTCGHCPQIQSHRNRDLSTRIFQKKQRLYQSLNKIHFVTCSRWLQGVARQSALLADQHITAIPNPLPTGLFKPGDRRKAREALSLPTEGKLLLFGAVKLTDKRKGIDYLVEACHLLARQHPELKDNLGIVALGRNAESLHSLLPFRVHPLGYIGDDHRLVQVYQAADLFVTPSLEENLPNTIMESMACGTPCVGFDTGGISEMIDHGKNGYVARYCDATDLAEGIYDTLYSPRYAEMSREAVSKAGNSYAEDVVARRYLQIYQSLTLK